MLPNPHCAPLAGALRKGGHSGMGVASWRPHVERLGGEFSLLVDAELEGALRRPASFNVCSRSAAWQATAAKAWDREATS